MNDKDRQKIETMGEVIKSSTDDGLYAGRQEWNEADACEVCGAGPQGRCDPPDDFAGECPHGCSPER